jgi:hypothetical protein
MSGEISVSTGCRFLFNLGVANFQYRKTYPQSTEFRAGTGYYQNTSGHLILLAQPQPLDPLFQISSRD